MDRREKSPGEGPFRLGVNYCIAAAAMYGWKAFDRARVSADLGRVSEAGLDIVRIFPSWEDLQPAPRKVSTTQLDHLVDVAEQAERWGLKLMPTLFTGHLCGLNWMPPWTLWAKERDLRFPVFCMGKVRRNVARNPYEDTGILEAQALLLREVSGALQGHPALWAWDLGNRPSRVALPPDGDAAGLWLRAMSEELRARDASIPITLGMSVEDLWIPGALRPADAAPHLDFLSMQHDPFFASPFEDPLDPRLIPFLALLANWLGGKDVLFSSVGVPTRPRDGKDAGGEGSRMLDEEEASSYLSSALDGLREAGASGALLWCLSDCHPSLWTEPPFDERVHERHHGIFLHDGSPKAFGGLLEELGSRDRAPPGGEPPGWIDLSVDEYLRDPATHLPRLFHHYRE